MLESLFINTLTAFSDDYKALCKSHYPTIHNRGMSPAHLSAAFNRRLISLAKCNGSTISNQLVFHDTIHHIFVYSILIDKQKVWIIYPQFLNAKTEAKSQMLSSIKYTIDNLGFEVTDSLAILCDHWFDRTRSSKALYHWWTGMLPEQNESYLKQGIHNQFSEDDFAAVLETAHSMACVNRSIYHPLESNQQHALLKYFLCFALFQNKSVTD